MARRPRPAKDYRRRGPVREPYDLVLIICEGKKTEPQYFRGLRQMHRLSSANVMIVPSQYGNDPVSLVKFAIDKHREDKGLYNRMYCVFDRNGHAGYQQALDAVAKSPLAKAQKLFAITSVPCFEIWVLLHFAYSTAPFAAAGPKSSCDRVIDAVHVHFLEYEKASADVYEKLEPRIEAALANAKLLAKHNTDTGSQNPSTLVHELVHYLRALKAN